MPTIFTPKALVDGPQALTLDELPLHLEDVAIARETHEKRRALSTNTRKGWCLNLALRDRATGRDVLQREFRTRRVGSFRPMIYCYKGFAARTLSDGHEPQHTAPAPT